MMPKYLGGLITLLLDSSVQTDVWVRGSGELGANYCHRGAL